MQNLNYHYTEELLNTEDLSFLSEFYERLGFSSRVFVWPKSPETKIVDMVINDIKELTIVPTHPTYNLVLLNGSDVITTNYIEELRTLLTKKKNASFFKRIFEENVYGGVTKTHLDLLHENIIETAFYNELRISFMDGAVAIEEASHKASTTLIGPDIYKKLTDNTLYMPSQLPTSIDQIPSESDHCN